MKILAQLKRRNVTHRAGLYLIGVRPSANFIGTSPPVRAELSPTEARESPGTLR